MQNKFLLTISVDDTNPADGYKVIGEKTGEYFRKLNEEFGVKFTHFVPSNYHKKYPLSQHKEWVKDMSEIPYIRMEAHGYYHMTDNPQRYGECEFFPLTKKEAIQRVFAIEDEWYACNFDTHEMGFRFPGWLSSEDSKEVIENHFKWAAIHYEHNQGMKWKIPTLYGHDNINQTTISIHNENCIMFQSHIAGNHNMNVWNDNNYEQLRLSLAHLFENYEIECKFLSEL